MYVSNVTAMKRRENIEDPVYSLPAGVMQQPGLGMYLSDRTAMRYRRSITNPVCALPDGVMQQPGLGALGGTAKKRHKTAKGKGVNATARMLRNWTRNRRGGPTDACSSIWNSARQTYPQLTLQEFFARVPQCGVVLNCGDNRLSDGSVVAIACTTNPVAKPNNYVFLGDVSSGDLLSSLSDSSSLQVNNTLLYAGLGLLAFAVIMWSGRKASSIRSSYRKSRAKRARRKQRIQALKYELASAKAGG